MKFSKTELISITNSSKTITGSGIVVLISSREWSGLPNTVTVDNKSFPFPTTTSGYYDNLSTNGIIIPFSSQVVFKSNADDSNTMKAFVGYF